MLKQKVFILLIFNLFLINILYSSDSKDKSEKNIKEKDIAEEISKTDYFPKGIPEIIAEYAAPHVIIRFEGRNEKEKDKINKTLKKRLADNEAIISAPTKYPSIKGSIQIIGLSPFIKNYENIEEGKDIVIPMVVPLTGIYNNKDEKLEKLVISYGYKKDTYSVTFPIKENHIYIIRLIPCAKNEQNIKVEYNATRPKGRRIKGQAYSFEYVQKKPILCVEEIPEK